MYEVLIRSIIPKSKRKSNRIAEWIETISAASKSAASRKANRWLEKELFAEDYVNIKKWQLGKNCQVWDLR